MTTNGDMAADRALDWAAVVADRQPDGTFARYPSPTARQRMNSVPRDIAEAIEVLEAGGADDYVIELLTSAQTQLRHSG